MCNKKKEVVYLQTEVALIIKEFESAQKKGFKGTLDEFAASWIKLNAEAYARKHNFH